MGSNRCDEALGKVYLYLDGEMTWYRRLRIKRHLRSCDGCGDAYWFESRFRTVIKDRLDEEPPPEFIERLRDYLREEGPADPD
jgi:mycothiol system anti-sigma-R factor